MSQNICTLEQAKLLKKLGVTQFSSMSYYEYPQGAHIPTMDSGVPGRVRLKAIANYPNHPQGGANDFAAFDVAELGELLPKGVRSGKFLNEPGFEWHCDANTGDRTYGNTEAEARANMLINMIRKRDVNPESLEISWFAPDYHQDAQIRAARAKYKQIIANLTAYDQMFLLCLDPGPHAVQLLHPEEIRVMDALVAKEAMEIGSTDGSGSPSQRTYTACEGVMRYLRRESGQGE